MIEPTKNVYDVLTLVFAGVAAGATFATAWLAYTTRKFLTTPKVIAYYDVMEEDPFIGHLYIKNIGASPAFSVKFELNPKNEGGKLLIEDFSKSLFLGRKLEHIGPGQTIKSSFTNALENSENKKNGMFEITITYKNSKGKKFSDPYAIDASQFEGMTFLVPPIKTISKSLEKIQKSMDSIDKTIKK